MKLELNLFNIISSLNQVLVFIFALLFQYISNVGTAFYFLTKFCVFSLLTVVLKFTVHSIFFIKILNVLYSSYFLHLLLLQHGDIESNPGPKKEQIKYLSCCHWNVNSLLAQNMCKISQIEAYNSLYNYDFICISETYFDSSILEGDRNFQLNGCHLIRADHPSNTKRGGVCIYHKESLGVRLVKFSNLSQCIICEVFLQNCKGYIGVVYRSPSQDNVEFENFLSNFDELLSKTISSNSLFTIILGDFNARSSSWWKEDKTTTEGTHLEALTSLYNFDQLISEPTHILPNSSSCIDLIFTNQPNLVVNCGTHSTLNTKCHHQITHCKLNLNIDYPPPYERLVWNYKKANTESIKKSLESVNWKTLFNNKTVNKQVSIFNETIINIFSNFVPNKLVTFDDSDPPWMSDFIKNKIK